MSAMMLLGMAVAGLFAALAWLAIWARRHDRMRFAAVALFLTGLPVLYAAGLQSLSWARPLWAMWDLAGHDLRVLGAKMIENEAIYLYVDDGTGQPRSVALPWDARQASDLQGLFDDPANRGQAMMRFNFELSWETREPLAFYPLPQPPLPLPKIEQPGAPHIEI